MKSMHIVPDAAGLWLRTKFSAKFVEQGLGIGLGGKTGGRKMYAIRKCRMGHEIHIHDSGKITGVECPECIKEVAKYFAKHGKKAKVRSHGWRLQGEAERGRV